MTNKYIDLTDRIGEGAEYSNTTSFCLGIECALRWLDEHPDQAPVQTITESEFEDSFIRTQPVETVRKRLKAHGITVVQDPKPPMTAVEAWIEERRAIQGSGVPFADRDSRAQFSRALNALEAVIELHKPLGYIGRDGETVWDECEHCHGSGWPCETVEAIEGAINE